MKYFPRSTQYAVLIGLFVLSFLSMAYPQSVVPIQIRNANLTTSSTQNFVTTLGSFTAPRTLTLPGRGAMSSYYLQFIDTANTISAVNTLTIRMADGGLINGSATFVLSVPGAYAFFTPSSSGLWANVVYPTTGGGNPAGGTNGQVQYNNAGSLGGFTVSGDGTLNTSTGVFTFGTVNANVGTFGSATQCATVTVNAKGLVTAASHNVCTPAIASVTGLGTGIATALAINTGSAGAPVLFNGAGGTPASMVGTNITGTATALNIGGNAATATNATTATTASAVAVGGITGLSANCGTWLATASSANLLACMTDETGTGGALVFAQSPGFVDSTTVVATPGGSAWSIVSAENNLAKIFSWRTSGSRRWSIRVDGNETGGNAASNWSVRRYDDTGTFIDSVLDCVRSTGICTFAFPIVGSGASLTALNASNLSTGTVAAARGGAGTVNGVLAGDGAGAVSQGTCAGLSGVAASCATDTTNAANITSGTLPPARLAGLNAITNSLSGNVNMTAATTYFDGPSIAQGSTGTWFVSGTVTLADGTATPITTCKLWDGTTVIASAPVHQFSNSWFFLSLSGYLATPAGNLRISCASSTGTTNIIRAASQDSTAKASTISAFRIN